MSNYNTGNLVPSADPRDLDDNATNFDLLLMSDAASVPDRLGTPRKTYSQMERDAASLVSPNVAALAALTAGANLGVFFSTGSPGVTMGTYPFPSFSRGLLASADGPSFRTAIGAIGSADNITGSAAKLTTPRTIATTGDASWSASFDGSANVTGALSLSATGVAAGTYGSVTVDAKGRATAGTAVTPIANGGTGNAATTMANLTLLNSWAVIATRAAAYRKAIDFVFLELQIVGGTATDGTILANLPAGFRPPRPISIPVASAPSTTLSPTVQVPTIAIAINGDISCQNCSSAVGIKINTLFSLV